MMSFLAFIFLTAILEAVVILYRRARPCRR